MKEVRALTKRELAAVRSLAAKSCANYDKAYDVCPLLGDYGCYMPTKRLADNKLCKYFEQAVLPLNPDLQRVFSGGTDNRSKPCAVCGRKFQPNGRKAYCSESCREQGSRTKEREKKRKQRENRGVSCPDLASKKAF